MHLAGTLTLRPTALTSPEARALIAALDAELTATYPEDGALHFRLDAAEVDAGRGAFLVAHLDGEPVGCGAIRRLSADSVELKRMYVAPVARGRGVARRLLAALEAEAIALGAARMLLETGARQHQAIAMYTRAGYAPIAPFGEYPICPLSLCMAKDLAPATGAPAAAPDA
jgi:putative acetyltransferase